MKVEDCKYFAIINKETAALLLDDSAYTVSVDKPEYHNIKYKGMNLTYIGYIFLIFIKNTLEL